MKKLIAIAVFALCTAVNAATPTFADINSAMVKGDVVTARVLMDEVLRKRPESVKAHTLNASLLAQENASKEKIEAEIALVNKLSSGVELPKIIAKPESKTMSYVLTGVCFVAIITACLLAAMYATIRSRSKTVKPLKGENQNVQEIDPSNYSVALSTHGECNTIAKGH